MRTSVLLQDPEVPAFVFSDEGQNQHKIPMKECRSIVEDDPLGPEASRLMARNAPPNQRAHCETK
jgi:hypothetical protein